jgi:hypothetical protein
MAENGPARPKRLFDENVSYGLWKMIFSGIKFTGAYTVDIDRREDNRGYFTRVFCEEDFSAPVSFLNSRRWLFPTVTQLLRDTALRWLQADTRHTHTRQGPLR